MNIDIDNPNRNYLLNLHRNIIKTENGYCLQKVYEESKDGSVIEIPDSNNSNNNQYSKNCYRCIHSENEICLLRTKLENCPENQYIPFSWVGNCDAYSPVYPLNLIESEDEMIAFIEKTEHFFNCPERYESYFGFERKWDEETGKILETTREYYDRGGSFTNIPDKFPCVIYFGVVDFNAVSPNVEKLDWIYIE